MTQNFRRFLLFTLICFVSLGAYFYFGWQDLPRAKAGNFSLLNDSPPYGSVTPYSVYLNGNLVDLGQYSSVSVYFKVSANNQGQLDYRSVNTDPPVNLNAPIRFSQFASPLNPDFDYCAQMYYSAQGAYNVPLGDKVCFHTSPATSDADIRTTFYPFTWTPERIEGTTVYMRGRLEGLKSGQTATYWFEIWEMDMVNYQQAPGGKKQKTGSGWVPVETITGLQPNHDYFIRLMGEFNGERQNGDFVLVRTGAGPSGNSAGGFFYCPVDLGTCSQVAASVYSGSDIYECHAALRRIFGDSTNKFCYKASEQTLCDSVCKNQSKRVFNYCDRDFEDCVLTKDAYTDQVACNEFLKTKFGSGTSKVCYETGDVSTCNARCRQLEAKTYVYCKDGPECSETASEYQSKEACNKALRDKYGEGTNKRCYYKEERVACNDNCRSGGTSASSQPSSSGNGGRMYYTYYFCPKDKATCIATEKPSLTDCNNVLKVAFPNDKNRRCYASDANQRKACNEACAKMSGVRYFFCMNDTGQCYQTNQSQISPAVCKSYILGKYGKRTNGWCYEEKAECTKNCKIVGEKPPTNFSGEKFYVCTKATGKCSVTYQYQGYDLKLCADAINKNMPGKTNGRCYKDIEDCSLDCTNGIEEAPIQDNGLAASFDWRNYKKQNWLTGVKNQGICGGCWAFSGTAAIEAKYNIDEKMANLDINLSEQDIISCSGQGSCKDGGPDGGALEAFKSGVVDEQCFPYNSTNWRTGNPEPTCNKCVDASSRQWRISDYGFIEPGNTDAIKRALTEKGPLITSYFAGGKVDGEWVKVDYSKPVVSCSKVGRSTNHSIVVVGYDDKEQAWIVRNSWGVNWPRPGAGGYFKIGYGSCGIFSEGAYFVQQVIVPQSK